MGAFEEMVELHRDIPGRASEREIKEIWREENPHGNIYEYESSPTVNQWREERKASREDLFTQASARWKAESPNLSALEKIDQQIGSGLALNDGQANKTYTSLKQRVDDTHLISSMPSYARAALKPLVEDAKEQILRNADKLALVVRTAKSVAGDEIEARAKLDGGDPTAARTEWETKSELYKALDEIEKILPEWDKLLAKDALPDPDELLSLAHRFDRAFGDFESKHAKVYNADTTPSYVKYQLPATMAALSEKIASQFAAHAGEPSFSAAYSLMMEVPHSGTYEDSRESAKKLTTKALGKGFITEREQFIKTLKNVRTLDIKTLQGELNNIDKLVASRGLLGSSPFEKWENAYEDVGDTKKQKKALPALYESTAKLAFQLKNYQQAIDRFLKDANSPNANLYAKPYVQTLDGFITAITEKLATAKSLAG
jgi:hypothetical protein